MTEQLWLKRHHWITGAMLGVGIVAGLVWWRFATDMAHAHARVARGSVLIQTRCGPIEYQEAGAGVPLLSIHGSGGGFDRGMTLASALPAQGVRVIAMSRFGYLRTPMPRDASADAQADAHLCLLDALGIRRTAVLGYSAGSASALQMAIRHPNRTSALILLAPITYSPPISAASAASAASAQTTPSWIEITMVHLSGSDFAAWAALGLMRKQMISTVLGTSPGIVTAASPVEQARVNAMLEVILPVSERAKGLRSDTAAIKHLTPADLNSVRAPTLIVSARDDRYDTYSGADFTARHIVGARFIGFAKGGHTWVGHDDAVMAAIVQLLSSQR